MKWTYRVSKQTLSNGDVVFAIREFYHDKQGRLDSWTEEEIAPIGNSLEDLKGELALIMQALEHDVVDIGDEKNGIGDPPEWEALANKAINTLKVLCDELRSEELTDIQKMDIVKTAFKKLGE